MSKKYSNTFAYNDCMQAFANNAVQISLCNYKQFCGFDFLPQRCHFFFFFFSPVIVPAIWMQVRKARAKETLLFIRKETDGEFVWLSCLQCCVWLAMLRNRDAMAGIAHMTGEVTNGRMLANLSAPLSCFSFLSQTGRTCRVARQLSAFL